MKNNGVTILYKEISPQAKENFTPASNESQFDTLAQLQKYNLAFPNYANPCELYSVILDGKAQPFPIMPESANLGLWSKQLSDDRGEFANPVVLTLTSDAQYSSQGLTFTFDTHNKIYPRHINIHWYRNSIDLGEKDFYPDSAVYVCKNAVENYNKIIITFTNLNMPQNRLKLRAVDYGYDIYLYGDELRSVKLIQELDPISSEIVINTADFTIDNQTDRKFLFQEKQPLSIYFNGKLKATSFVTSYKRKTKNLYQIQSEDYIGLLDGVIYYGDIYKDASIVDVLSDIFAVANVPFEIDENLSNKKITGHIPYGTCREALMQVAFAVQAVVDTSDSDVVKIYELDNDVKQKIDLDRIMQGQNFTFEDTITGIEITAHSYDKTNEKVIAFNASESGIEVGENDVIIKFSDPLYDLKIGHLKQENDEERFVQNITYGEIVSSGSNHAIIRVHREGCALQGKKYKHNESIKCKNNPIVLANVLEKVITIKDATLIHSGNVDNVLEKCYNWLTKTNSTNLKIVERRSDTPISVGEKIEAATEYLGDVEGRIIKQSFNLNGGIIIKEAVLK